MVTLTAPTPEDARRASWLPWFSLGLVLLLLAALKAWRFDQVPFVDDVGVAATKVIASLLVVTLLIERSLAAVNAALWGAETGRAEAALRSLDVDHRLGSLTAADVRVEAEPYRLFLAEADAQQERARVLAGFACGLLASAAGIRVLAALVKIDGVAGAPVDPQRTLAHTVDIVLTAGLIAGGSKGLADLLAAIKAAMGDRPKLR